MLHVRQLRVTLDGRLVGRLASSARGQVWFEYEAAWLSAGFDIAPHTMPFVPGSQKAASSLFDGLHGVFNDSLPDGWGMLLMDRALRQFFGWPRHEVLPLDRLAYIGERALGALSYEPELELPHGNDVGAALDLARLAQSAQKVLAGDEADVLRELLLHGGSPGGARPKVTLARRPSDGACVAGFTPLQPGFEHWMVKFPARADSAQAGRIEYAYAEIARRAGLTMPPSALIEVPQLTPSGRPSRREPQRFFAVKRFDREGDTRIHMLSLSGHLYATHLAPSLGYDTLMAATLRLTQSVQEVERAFRWMVFNAVMHNRDDHSKNFAFLHRSGRWRLSPAYDLTFSPGIGGQHSSDIHGSGHPQRSDALAVGRSAGLADPATIIDEVVEAAGAWMRLAGQLEMAGGERRAIGTAIQTMRRRMGTATTRVAGAVKRRR